MTKRIVVAGSRDYTNKARVFEVLDKVAIDQSSRGILIEIVSGLARGPDTFGKEWAEENEFTVHEFPADWDKYGKKAGFIRNKEMAEFADIVLAFWDGSSRGTKMMIDITSKINKKVIVITD